MNKTHISLNVDNLGKAVDFYRKLFRAEPAKRKPGYANFDLDNPPLKLALNETAAGGGRLSHLGVQVPDSKTVAETAAHFTENGLDSRSEENTDCCYALQDKVWVTDPDGNAWEVFTVKAATTPSTPVSANCACAT